MNGLAGPKQPRRSWRGVARAIVLPMPGGIWAAAWGEADDDPDYTTVATILDFEPPQRMVLSESGYHAKGEQSSSRSSSSRETCRGRCSA